MIMSVKLKKSNSSKSGLYLLFAELFHRELDPQLLKLLRQPEVLEGLVDAEPSCEEYIQRSWSAADYEEASVDFCDLFIMPESSSAPRAAAWLDIGGELTAEAVDAVIVQFVTEWKIEVPPTYKYLAYDHISLIFYLAAVIDQQDPALAAEFEEAVLYPWVGAFGASLEQSKYPLYRALGVILVSIQETN